MDPASLAELAEARAERALESGDARTAVRLLVGVAVKAWQSVAAEERGGRLALVLLRCAQLTMRVEGAECPFETARIAALAAAEAAEAGDRQTEDSALALALRSGLRTVAASTVIGAEARTRARAVLGVLRRAACFEQCRRLVLQLGRGFSAACSGPTLPGALWELPVREALAPLLRFLLLASEAGDVKLLCVGAGQGLVEGVLFSMLHEAVCGAAPSEAALFDEGGMVVKTKRGSSVRLCVSTPAGAACEGGLRMCGVQHADYEAALELQKDPPTAVLQVWQPLSTGGSGVADPVRIFCRERGLLYVHLGPIPGCGASGFPGQLDGMFGLSAAVPTWGRLDYDELQHGALVAVADAGSAPARAALAKLQLVLQQQQVPKMRSLVGAAPETMWNVGMCDIGVRMEHARFSVLGGSERALFMSLCVYLQRFELVSTYFSADERLQRSGHALLSAARFAKRQLGPKEALLAVLGAGHAPDNALHPAAMLPELKDRLSAVQCSRDFAQLRAWMTAPVDMPVPEQQTSRSEVLEAAAKLQLRPLA